MPDTTIETIVPQLWPRWQGICRPEEVYSNHGSGICCIPDTMIDTCSQEKTQLKDAGFQTYQISAINFQCWYIYIYTFTMIDTSLARLNMT